MKYKHPLINKAIAHYRYNDAINKEQAWDQFVEEYRFNITDYKKSRYDFSRFASTLQGLPESTHIPAKNLLWQGNQECWWYFERTALFWTITALYENEIDALKNALEYALYIERRDLLEMLIKKIIELAGSAEHRNEPVYPSTCLMLFLTTKWLEIVPEPELSQIMENGYRIYQPIIDHWADMSALGPQYWNSLCEYHLDQLSLTRPDKRNGEEFIGTGLVPMELLNLQKVRIKLSLSVPEIAHELMTTPMSVAPKIPTGYDEKSDVIYQTVKDTAENQRLYSYPELRELIRK